MEMRISTIKIKNTELENENVKINVGMKIHIKAIIRYIIVFLSKF
jgi:hypothetical protein